MFGKLAPAYWAKGISVIPLIRNSKRPVQNNWSRFCSALPTDEEQELFVRQYQENNIGLALGPQSGIVVLDIDTDDQAIMDAIVGCFPKSPWERVGKRGKVLAYRYSGITTKHINGVVNGKECGIVDILSTGAQVVLPPSIHPDTMKPYVSNCELLDVYDQLPILPDNAEDIIRLKLGTMMELTSSQASKRFSTTEFVASGARDNAMNRYAGFLSHAVLRGEMSVKSALQDMLTWTEARVQDVSGDSVDVAKGQGQVIQYILQDVTSKGKILPSGWDTDLTEAEKKSWGFILDEDQEEWTVEQHLKFIDGLNNNCPKNSPERHQGEFSVLKKLSKSVTLSSLDIDRVLTTLKTGSGLTVAQLRKQIKELKAGPVQGISHTEIARALMSEITKKQGDLAFYNDVVWCWNGAHWEKLQEQVVREFLQNEYGSLDLAKRGSDHKQIVNVLKDQVPQKITVDGDMVVGVNFANGFLNKELKLVPHSPDFGMTYTLPFPYLPEMAGKCPKFFAYLKSSWGDDPDYEDKLIALQEAISATLFGVMTSFSRAMLLYGTPGSGKSVLMKVVSAVVPPEARCALSPDKWAEQFVASNFAGKLLNAAGELDEKKKINGKLFKEIVSGEEMTTRGLYRDAFLLKPKAAHWICSNHLPKSNDTSNGFNRRWLIFNFTKAVPKEQIIMDLEKEIIYEEMEALVAWALTAFIPLMKRQTFTIPSSHDELLKDMSLQNSDVRQWIEHRISKEEGSEVTQEALYKDYFFYALNILNVKALPPKVFGIELEQMLLEMGIKGLKITDKARIHTGIKLNKVEK